jgi:serine/threonine protein kinase
MGDERRQSLCVAPSVRGRRASSHIYLDSVYTTGERIGSGAFGIVYEGTALVGGASVAIKVVGKDRPSADVDQETFAAHLEQVRNEIKALEALASRDLDASCDAIIGFHGAFETVDKISIVMDRADGELAEVVTGAESFTEIETRQILKRVLEAVAYMHERDYVHRDLKFENLLMMKAGDFSSIVLTDFGLATKTSEAATGECGTPLYMSPEIWTRNSVAHGPKVDVWAVGIIAHILLCGRHPIKATSLADLKAQVCVERIALDFAGTGVSDAAQDFVRRLLTADPMSRPAAKDALGHPFMTGALLGTVEGSVFDMLRAYAAEVRLKKSFRLVHAVKRIQAFRRLSGNEVAADETSALHARLPPPGLHARTPPDCNTPPTGVSSPPSI